MNSVNLSPVSDGSYATNPQFYEQSPAPIDFVDQQLKVIYEKVIHLQESLQHIQEKLERCDNRFGTLERQFKFLSEQALEPNRSKRRVEVLKNPQLEELSKMFSQTTLSEGSMSSESECSVSYHLVGQNLCGSNPSILTPSRDNLRGNRPKKRVKGELKVSQEATVCVDKDDGTELLPENFSNLGKFEVGVSFSPKIIRQPKDGIVDASEHMRINNQVASHLEVEDGVKQKFDFSQIIVNNEKNVSDS